MISHVPNFFIVGAPKSGTTSLCRYLAQHRSVYLSPIKEPCFFAPEVVSFEPRARAIFEADAEGLRAYLDGPMREPRGRGVVLDWDQYLRLFRHVGEETAIGEGSVAYLGSLTAPQAIRTRIPDARILMILRDPAERLFSHYTALRAAGAVTRPFVEWIEEQTAVEEARSVRIGPIWAGRYALHLQRYLATFSASRVRAWCHDDFARDPAGLLKDVFTFLGVDPTCSIDVSQRHNVTEVPRWAVLKRLAAPVRRNLRAMLPAGVGGRLLQWSRVRSPLVMTAEERTRAIDLYRDDIRDLERLLERDLSAWRI